MKAIIHIEVRQASRLDFILGDQVDYGRIFYLKKKEWAHLHGPYSLKTDYVKSGEFKEWLDLGLVYVKITGEFPLINVQTTEAVSRAGGGAQRAGVENPNQKKRQ